MSLKNFKVFKDPDGSKADFSWEIRALIGDPEKVLKEHLLIKLLLPKPLKRSASSSRAWNCFVDLCECWSVWISFANWLPRRLRTGEYPELWRNTILSQAAFFKLVARYQLEIIRGSDFDDGEIHIWILERHVVGHRIPSIDNRTFWNQFVNWQTI